MDYETMTHEWEGAIALLDTPSDDHRLLINAYGRVLNRLQGRPVPLYLQSSEPEPGFFKVGNVEGYLTRGNELRAIGSLDLAYVERVRPDVAEDMRAGKLIPVAPALQGSSRAATDLDDIEVSIRRGIAAAVLEHDLTAAAGKAGRLDEPKVDASGIELAYDDWELKCVWLAAASPWPGVGIGLDDFTGSLDIRIRKPPRA